MRNHRRRFSFVTAPLRSAFVAVAAILAGGVAGVTGGVTGGTGTAAVGVPFVPAANAAHAASAALPADVVFCIGKPDQRCAEFALAREGYAAFPSRFAAAKGGVNFTVGKSRAGSDWPFVHPANRDTQWSKTAVAPFTLRFALPAAAENKDLTLVLGYMATMPYVGSVRVSVNGTALPAQNPQTVGGENIVFRPADARRGKGRAGALLFTLPAAALKTGGAENAVVISLHEGSWLLYDYVALRSKREPLIVPKPEPNLLAEFRTGADAPMRGVREVVFAVRGGGTDEHWYANFGYYADNDKRIPMRINGGQLCVLDLDTKKVRVLLDDPAGSVRDPQVSYDASRILFSYRPAGSEHFHLYDIAPDGSGLRQLTDGDADDIEPTYTAAGKIIFVSSRAKRWVQCWITPVAHLYGCDPDGKNIHPLSGNVEHDNTPWPLHDGRILYMRWEYVDRSQVHYHHLWTMNPDGTKQMVYYGNMHPGTVYIDAKPIPNSQKIVTIASWGHGATEHNGSLALIDPSNGPDDKSSLKVVARPANYRDPWAFSEHAFLAVRGSSIVLLDDDGNEQTLYAAPSDWRAKQWNLHEPRPIVQRTPERRISAQTDNSAPNAQLSLFNVYEGRNMTGVAKGDIKKLLILESLPKPINFTGGMEPLSYGGTFTLERVIGTVPVEEDGSAYFELPALRSFFFVALDKDDRAVKRMQSFVSLMPGEVNSCIGCHEERTLTPPRGVGATKALRRGPSPITPLAAYNGQDGLGRPVPQNTLAAQIPDVLDYPRDIQPIWNKHCVSCHSTAPAAAHPPRSLPNRPAAGLDLSADRGPLYSLSYYDLTARALVADGRNLPKGNYPPRALGTGGSRLLKYTDGTHHNARLSPREQTLLRLWIETGAPYPGTYAGLGSGMVGGYAQNRLDRRDTQWPEVKLMADTLKNTCSTCHTRRACNPIPLTPTDETGGPPWETLGSPNRDPRRRYSRNQLYNLTHPARSRVLLAPLAATAGGWATVEQGAGKATAEGGASSVPPVHGRSTTGTTTGSAAAGTAPAFKHPILFASTADPRYRAILAGIERERAWLEEIRRFDMPGFQPRPQYIREMKKFGILPPTAPLPPEHNALTGLGYRNSAVQTAPGVNPVATAGAAEITTTAGTGTAAGTGTTDAPPPTTYNPYELDQQYWRTLWHRPAPATAAK
ncbi:MAG: hypothetical protein LBR07_10240 [Puniceicoccales bacterium]|jgi:hypothetical protein|nr:hypothetical protein [Puniceicoccales bacterium]